MAKKKNKIPKRIAGIKVPKALRRSAPSLIGLLQTPQGKEAAAAALSAAATALLTSAQGRRAITEAGSTAAGAGSAVASGLESVGHVAASVLKQAAQSLLPDSGNPEGGRAETIGPTELDTKRGDGKKQRGALPIDPISKH